MGFKKLEQILNRRPGEAEDTRAELILDARQEPVALGAIRQNVLSIGRAADLEVVLEPGSILLAV